MIYAGNGKVIEAVGKGELVVGTQARRWIGK